MFTRLVFKLPRYLSKKNDLRHIYEFLLFRFGAIIDYIPWVWFTFVGWNYFLHIKSLWKTLNEGFRLIGDTNFTNLINSIEHRCLLSAITLFYWYFHGQYSSVIFTATPQFLSWFQFFIFFHRSTIFNSFKKRSGYSTRGWIVPLL